MIVQLRAGDEYQPSPMYAVGEPETPVSHGSIRTLPVDDIMHLQIKAEPHRLSELSYASIARTHHRGTRDAGVHVVFPKYDVTCGSQLAAQRFNPCVAV